MKFYPESVLPVYQEQEGNVQYREAVLKNLSIYQDQECPENQEDRQLENRLADLPGDQKRIPGVYQHSQRVFH